jgi:hypothetical protein
MPEKRASTPEVIAGYIRSSVAGRDVLADLDPDLYRADFRPYTDYLLGRVVELEN